MNDINKSNVFDYANAMANAIKEYRTECLRSAGNRTSGVLRAEINMYAVEAGFRDFVQVYGNRVGIGEIHSVADARLVAAAPDLLAVMERCITVLSTLETPGCLRSGSPSLVKDCRAVVAKAKGTTP